MAAIAFHLRQYRLGIEHAERCDRAAAENLMSECPGCLGVIRDRLAAREKLESIIRRGGRLRPKTRQQLDALDDRRRALLDHPWA